MLPLCLPYTSYCPLGYTRGPSQEVGFERSINRKCGINCLSYSVIVAVWL